MRKDQSRPSRPTAGWEKAAEPKELAVIDGATHIDLYDRDAHVTAAVDRLTAFFTAHLTR
ncbi:alpha/beta hydrolase [Streptomyces sp. NRRL S-340]|uniref:alpha/beta hydrolase n=1 Tax=Streptomyces sp. NRRL S-340 TaxID=1463901 RepID=UPI00055B05AB|nr:alpha/beta hydrolase [Streptomyces sp. NRRL S-340]